MNTANSQLSTKDTAACAIKASERINCPEMLAVFPLPVFLLPSGVTRLRIFEPRYLTMIAQCSDGRGFVIMSHDKSIKGSLPDWGTRVQVVDFHSGEDGLLVVDVQAMHLVSLSEMNRRKDNLLFAKTRHQVHWSDLAVQPSLVAIPHPTISIEDTRPHDLALVLKKLFGENYQLEKVYQQTYFDSPEWVCARFLEIIPLSLNEKDKFIDALSLEQTKTFLYTLVLGEENIN
jgi:Lon protease-like protein